MEKLQTSYLDLLLIHQPFGDYYGTYRAMEELYKTGKLRAIGVSNFGPDRYLDIQYFATVKPAVNQIETHVFQQQKVAREYLQKYNCQPESWGSFAEGRNDMFTNPVLTKIGEKYGKTAAHFRTRADVLHNLSLRGVRIFAGLLFLFLISLSISAPEFFSAEMLDRNFVNLYGSSGLGNFSFYQSIIRVILFCNLSHQIYCPVSVFENPASFLSASALCPTAAP